MIVTTVRPLATVERPYARSVVVVANPVARLTGRQRDVLRAVSTFGVTEAARRLGLTIQGLKNQQQEIYQKLGLVNTGGSCAPRAGYMLGRYDAERG